MIPQQTLEDTLQYACVWVCEFSRFAGYAQQTNNFWGYTKLLQTLWNAFLGHLEEQNLDYRTKSCVEMVEHFRRFLCGLLHNQQLEPEAFAGDDDLQQLIQAGNEQGATIPCDWECPVPKGVAQQTLEAFVNFCAAQAQVSPEGLHEVPPPFVFAMALIPTSYVFSNSRLPIGLWRTFRQVITEITDLFDPDSDERYLVYTLGTSVGTQLLWPGRAGDSDMLTEACKEGNLNQVRIGDILRDILQVGAQEEGRGRGRRRRIAQRDVVETIIGWMPLREGWKERVRSWSQRREQGDREPQITHLSRVSNEEEAAPWWENIRGGSDVEKMAAAERVASPLLSMLDECINRLHTAEGCPPLDQLVQCLFLAHPCPEEGERPQGQGSAPIDLRQELAALAQNPEVSEKLENIDALIREGCQCENPRWPEPSHLNGRYLIDLLLEAERLLRRYEQVQRGRVDQKLEEAVQVAQERLGGRPSRREIAQEIRRDPCLWIMIVRKLVKG